MKSVFEFSNYKDYFRHLLSQENSRGLLSRFAEAAECQRPYLSKVLQLNSEVQLTPDHMYGICEHLNLPENESVYLKLLLERDRASSKKYRDTLESQIRSLKTQYLNIKKQIGKDTPPVIMTDSALYYSFWLYGAVHIAVSIPELQLVSALSKRFGMPTAIIEQTLEKLVAWGLVEKKQSRWVWKSGDLHISKDSPLVNLHHMNWRTQASQDAAMNRGDSTHYSVAQSLSQQDFEKLRYKMLEWIKHFQQVASPSKPEELVCFNLDFFRVGVE